MPRRKNARKQPRKPIRKYQRKQRAKSRMPFVEQKHKDQLVTASQLFQTDLTDVYIPDCFTNMDQGDGIDQMNGRWIYSKWLVTNMTMTFDQAVNYNFPLNIRVRYGWCKLNLNPSTPSSHVSDAVEVAKITALRTHVKQVLTNNYDDSTLLPQKARDVLTLGDFVIKNNPRLLENPSGGSITTFRQDKHLRFKWSPQRKIQYQKCIPPGLSTGVFYEANQKNWIPFVMFSRVQAGTETAPTHAQMPKVDIGTRHYFTDC